MRCRQRWFRCVVAIVLPCALLGGPLATLVWGGTLCPNQHAMHHQKGPCFCGHMAGATSMDLVSPVVLPAPVAATSTAVEAPLHRLGPATSRHDSPTYPPRHPPPKPIV